MNSSITQASADQSLLTTPAAPSAAAGEPANWRALNDVEWMNIVNHDYAYRSFTKDEAVHEAVKRTEAKLKEINGAAPVQPVAVPAGYALVPLEPTPEMIAACDLKFVPRLALPIYVAAYKTMLAAAPSPAAVDGAKEEQQTLDPNQVQSIADRIRNTPGLAAPSEQQVAPEQAGSLHSVVNAHCNDLLDCAAALEEDGRFAATVAEIRIAVTELRAAATQASAIAADRDAVDAARYRWLRRDAMNPHLRWSPRIGEPCVGGLMYRYVRNEQEFDAALDEQMKSTSSAASQTKGGEHE